MPLTGSAQHPVAKSSRGIFFTLSMMLLGISILSFAYFLSEQSAKSSRTAAWLESAGRTSGAYASIEDSLARIISPSINISVQNNTALIVESLPLGSQMGQDLDRFAQFESAYSDLNVSMDVSGLKDGLFFIQPSGAVVLNSPGVFQVTPQDSNESSGSLSGYDVELVFPAGGLDDAAWLGVSNSSGNLETVHVRARDAGWGVVLDFYNSVDKYATSALNITNGGATVAVVQFTSPSALVVQYASNMTLKTSAAFTNPVYVESADTISVLSAVNRTGRPRFA